MAKKSEQEKETKPKKKKSASKKTKKKSKQSTKKSKVEGTAEKKLTAAEKKKRSAILKVVQDTETKCGEGSVFLLGDGYAQKKVPKTTTGLAALDETMGGGLPIGRIIEIYGPESSGKTSLAYQILSMFDYAAYFPVEGTFEASRAMTFGNGENLLVFQDIGSGEQVFNKCRDLMKAGIECIVIDSIPSLIPKAIAEADFDDKQTFAPVAQLMSKSMPKLNTLVEKYGTILIFINQTRMDMNASLFGDKHKTPGGTAKDFYFSVRMKTANRQSITVSNKDPKTTEKETQVGMITKVRIVKNKVGPPRRECELPFFFDIGYVPHDDIKPIRQTIMDANNEKWGKRKKRKKSKED